MIVRLITTAGIFTRRSCLFYRDDDPSGQQTREAETTDQHPSCSRGRNNPHGRTRRLRGHQKLECILDTMERLGIRYYLLARESEILHLHLWDRAFQLMRTRE